MQWGKPLACLLMVATVAGSLPAQRRSRRALPQHYRFLQEKEDTETTARAVLRNGLTVLVEERAGLPLAAVVSYVADDSSLASPARSRLWKVSRQAARAADAPGRTAKAGGSYELRADPAGIAFSTLVPAENVLVALEIHRDLLTQAKALKDVSLRETDPGRSDGSWGARRRQQAELLYPVPESKGTPAGGELYSRRFRPSNVILSVSGSVLREELLRRVVELYGSLRDSGKPLRWKPRSPSIGEAFLYSQQRAELRQPVVLLGFRVPRFGHPDEPASRVLTTVLTDGLDSLAERLLIRRGLAVDLASSRLEAAGGTLWQVTLTARPDKLEAAEVGFLALLESLRTRLLDQHELNRAKALIHTDYLLELEKLENRAVLRARRELMGGSLEIDSLPAALTAVTPQAVQRVLNRYLTVSNLALIEVLPLNFEERSFTAESLAATLALLIPPQVEELAQQLYAFRATKEVAPLKLAPFKPRLADSRLKRTSVLRGPEVYLAESHRIPLSHVGLFLPGGRIDEGPAQRGLTELTLRSLAASAAGGPGGEFWREIESMGCRVAFVNREDFMGYRFSCLSAHTALLLDRVVRWLRDRELEAEAIEREQQRLSSQFDTQPLEPEVEGELLIRRQLFGDDHPYASADRGTEASLAGLNADSVRDWAERQFGGFHPVLVILGDVEGTAFLTPLISLLSDSRLLVKERSEKEALEQRLLAEAILEKSVLLGVPGPVLGARDDWLLALLEELLNQWAGNVPASQSSPGARQLRLWHRAYIDGGLVLAALAAGDTADASQTLRRALRDLPSAPIKEQDFLNGVVRAITGFYSRQQDSPRRLVDLAQSLLAGEKPDFEAELLTTWKGVRVDEIRALAQRLFSEIPVETAGSGTGEVSR